MSKRCATLALLAVLQGCYSYAPLESGVPPVGENIEFRVNDRGRLELGDRLGRGVATIEGRLTGMTDDLYQVNVASVSFISGEKNRWSGETMRLSRSHVETAAIRRFDKKRSWITAAIVVVGVGAFIASRGLLVDFFGETDNPPTEVPPASVRPSPSFP